jgi:hypothetical protein
LPDTSQNFHDEEEEDPDVDVTATVEQLAKFSELLPATLAETRLYSERVEQAFRTGIIGAASGDNNATGTDEGPPERQGQSSSRS